MAPDLQSLSLKEFETYSLGDFKLKSGGSIPDAHIAYKTFGDAANPAIIYPCVPARSCSLQTDEEWSKAHGTPEQSQTTSGLSETTR